VCALWELGFSPPVLVLMTIVLLYHLAIIPVSVVWDFFHLISDHSVTLTPAQLSLYFISTLAGRNSFKVPMIEYIYWVKTLLTLFSLSCLGT
jgi:hypothetical protein